MPPLRADLLDALAMPVPMVGGEGSPTDVLRGLVEGRPLPHRRETKDAALILAVTYRQLLECLKADLVSPPVPGRRRFNRTFEGGVLKVQPEQLVFAPEPSMPSKPAFKTHAFLTGLSKAFATELVQLAPPVVAAVPGDLGRHAVLGNVLSAVLATRCLAGQTIRVRPLKVATRPRWAPSDLVTWALPHLNTLSDEGRSRVFEKVKDVALAELITGTSRATVFRHRPRKTGKAESEE